MNQTRSPLDDILTVHLRGNNHSARVSALAPRVNNYAGMTLAQLQQNYELILSTRVIHYPVAYQILCEIGSGRQGVVLFALRHGARGCVTEHAIKLFDPDLYHTAEEYWTDMGRIAYQVGQLQHLQCSSLVPTDIYEETYGIGFVQMEAIDGLDVGRLMMQETIDIARQGYTAEAWERASHVIFRTDDQPVRLQPGVVVYILRAMLRGLERVHTLGFVHADIKPANIMIDRLGEVKLVDFGRAARIGECASFLLGSPQYMAPEIHRREAVTVQSDCYSLGLVALEMLSGRPISGSANTEEELLKIKLDLPNQLPDLLPSCLRANSAFLHILRKFLEPDPAKRYASASEADVGEDGLRIISKQLVRADLDAEYAHELALFLRNFAGDDDTRVGDYLPSVLLRGKQIG
ncbi:MAG: serine/threonine-protein kinase [bacterium]